MPPHRDPDEHAHWLRLLDTYCRRSARARTPATVHNVAREPVRVRRSRGALDAALARVRVLRPAGGEQWVTGRTYTVRFELPTPPDDPARVRSATRRTRSASAELGDVYVALVRREPHGLESLYDVVPIGAASRQLARDAARPGQYTCTWRVPTTLEAGSTYRVEVGSRALRCVGASEPLVVTEAAGQVCAESDVGVWCVCGATQLTREARPLHWVQCDACASWQHARCVQYRGTDGSASAYACPWCRSARPAAALAQQMLAMLALIAGSYVRRRADLLCCTPEAVALLVASLVRPACDRRIVDLGAGDGALAAALPPGVLCVERSASRVRAGRARLPQHEWWQRDVLAPVFVRWALEEAEPFDVVLCNADFEVALQFLYVALLLLPPRRKRDDDDDDSAGDARVLMLLPSDFFDGSAARARAYRLLDAHIECEYRLGHVSYYADEPEAEKRTCDSVFVIRPGARERKYEHRTVQARVAGML